MMESRAVTPSVEGAQCLEGEPAGGVDRSADEGRQGRVEEFFLTASSCSQPGAIRTHKMACVLCLVTQPCSTSAKHGL